MASQPPYCYSPMVGDYALGLPRAPMMPARLETKAFDIVVQPYGSCVIVRGCSPTCRRCGARSIQTAKIECPPHSTSRPPMHPRRIFGAHKHQGDCCRRPCHTVSRYPRRRGALLTSPVRSRHLSKWRFLHVQSSAWWLLNGCLQSSWI